MFLEKCLGIGVFSELVLWSLVNLVFTFAERHKMIKVCGEGRGGETSMVLKITREGDEEVAFSLRMVLAPSRIRIELTSQERTERLEESHGRREALFAQVVAHIFVEEGESNQLLEQLTQFFHRHVGPATSLAST